MIENEAVLNLISQTQTPLLKGLGNFKDEALQILENGIPEYLGNQYQYNSKLKTLLYRNEPQNLKEIYQHLRIYNKEEAILSNDIRKVFKDSRFVTIIGDAGSGKSTLMRFLFLNCIDTEFGIPVKIELRKLNDLDTSLFEFIAEKLLKRDVAKNKKILVRLFENGHFIFFFDGYDEVNSNSKKIITEQINEFVELYNENHFLLTTRPYSNVDMMPLFHNYRVKYLSIKEIEAFITKQKIEQELKAKIIKAISKKENIEYRSFLANPLLLTMFILKFRRKSNIPQKKIFFYRDVIETLFIEHDSTSKLGFEREMKSQLSQEEIEGILKIFSIISYFEGKYLFEKEYLKRKFAEVAKIFDIEKFSFNDLLEDLMVNVGLFVKEGTQYTFAHRSMQEYFASIYISELTDVRKEEIFDKIYVMAKDGDLNNLHNLLTFIEETDPVYLYKKIILKIINPIIEKIDRNRIGLEAKVLKETVVEIGYSKNDGTFLTKSLFSGAKNYLGLIQSSYIRKLPIPLGQHAEKDISEFLSEEEGYYYFIVSKHNGKELNRFIQKAGYKKRLLGFYEELKELQKRGREIIEKKIEQENKIINIIN